MYHKIILMNLGTKYVYNVILYLQYYLLVEITYAEIVSVYVFIWMMAPTLYNYLW